MKKNLIILIICFALSSAIPNELEAKGKDSNTNAPSAITFLQKSSFLQKVYKDQIFYKEWKGHYSMGQCRGYIHDIKKKIKEEIGDDIKMQSSCTRRLIGAGYFESSIVEAHILLDRKVSVISRKFGLWPDRLPLAKKSCDITKNSIEKRKETEGVRTLNLSCTYWEKLSGAIHKKYIFNATVIGGKQRIPLPEKLKTIKKEFGSSRIAKKNCDEAKKLIQPIEGMMMFHLSCDLGKHERYTLNAVFMKPNPRIPLPEKLKTIKKEFGLWPRQLPQAKKDCNAAKKSIQQREGITILDLNCDYWTRVTGAYHEKYILNGTIVENTAAIEPALKPVKQTTRTLTSGK